MRDKEEELETAMQKVDALRHDIRKAEKLRRELESRVEEALAEATKERKLRERSEEYCRQMQVESDRLRVRSDIGSRDQQDAQRLKAELEKLEVKQTGINVKCCKLFVFGCFSSSIMKV